LPLPAGKPNSHLWLTIPFSYILISRISAMMSIVTNSK